MSLIDPAVNDPTARAAHRDLRRRVGRLCRLLEEAQAMCGQIGRRADAIATVEADPLILHRPFPGAYDDGDAQAVIDEVFWAETTLGKILLGIDEYR